MFVWKVRTRITKKNILAKFAYICDGEDFNGGVRGNLQKKNIYRVKER